jgi:hypothetical protein
LPAEILVLIDSARRPFLFGSELVIATFSPLGLQRNHDRFGELVHTPTDQTFTPQLAQFL